MKLSIITVVYNGERFLEKTMQSVLSQSYENFEYIVIDGGSTDGTLALIDRYRDRLSVVVSEPDHGIYDAMNKGITLASGDVVGMINAGDYYLPGAFALVADALRGRDFNQSIFWGDVEYEHLGRVKGFRPKNLKLGAFAPHPSMFCPKAVYDRIGSYDTSFRFLGDYDFMYRAVNVCGIEPVYVPKPVAFYLEGGYSDLHVRECLQDELRVKLKYGQSKIAAYGAYYLKLLKNLPRFSCR